MINKMLKLRIFTDENYKMNLSIKDANGELLLVSQFTLYANCRDGNRPDFLRAAKPEKAEELYSYIVNKCRETGIKVETGVFREHMRVGLLNEGPITIILDSEDLKK